MLKSLLSLFAADYKSEDPMICFSNVQLMVVQLMVFMEVWICFSLIEIEDFQQNGLEN
jgi:hypothetical protein